MSYDDYLRSEHWRKLREWYYATHAACCGCCGHNGIRLSLHHKTYERLGCERIGDVIALCDSCHAGVHEIVENANRAQGTSTRYQTDQHSNRRTWRVVTLGTAVELLKERHRNEHRQVRREVKAQRRVEFKNKQRERRLAKRTIVALDGNAILVTDDFIMSGRFRGGWKRAQLALIGIEWPPIAGWKARAIGRVISRQAADRFVTLKDAPRKIDLNGKFWPD